MQTTTDLDKLRTGAEFTWGEIIKFHEIGEYTIVESHPCIFINCCGTNQIDYATKQYHCYINNEDICRSAESLDSAIVHCIAYKHNDSRAANYFMKMIKQEVK